jgi:glycogen phosphorylase
VAALWPDLPVEQVPIGHITNGIHLIGWMKGPVRKFWQRKLSGAGGAAEAASGDTTTFWKHPAISLEKEVNSTEFWQKWPTRISFPTRNSGPCATNCGAN